MPQRLIDSQEWRWVFVSSALLLIMLSLPFIWAYASAVPDRYFMGVLVNPIDGMSYQAKMMQGYEGSWFFQIPFTPEMHRGVFLFTFYLGMGHIARILNLEPILIFHVVRLVGGLFMFVALYRFVADWTDSVEQRRITWGLAVLGAGFGWIALAFHYLSPDLLLLPEAFPLQALYSNAHFPWAIALAAAVAHLLVTGALVEPLPWQETTVPTLALIVATIILVSISPFVLAPLAVGYGALCVWLWAENKKFPRGAIVWGSTVAIFGLPLGLYNAWAISAQNPIIQGWMQQNVTPSPPIWDYLIAYGPLLILAGLAIWGSRNQLDAGDAFLLGWIAATIVFLYLPIGLQRRFTLGLILPLATYAGRGLWRVLAAAVSRRLRFLVILTAFVSFMPTTIVAILLPLVGTLDVSNDLYYYITVGENQAFEWLEVNAGTDALVLASPETSLYIPAYGPRVVYGHPYETLQADARKSAVEDFYSGKDCSVVEKEQVDYIVVGPREKALEGASTTCLPTDQPVFQSTSGDIAIYAVTSR